MTEEDNDASLIIWALRFTGKARANLDAGREHFVQTAGEEIADAWQDGIETEIAKLSRLPERRPIAQENPRFKATVRSLSYRRSPTGPVYRILFTVQPASKDGPTVTVINIRHGAQATMTRKEAREIEAAE